MANFLGGRVHLVEDVLEELERLAKDLPALAALLRDWPSTSVRELDLKLKAEVAVVLKARKISDGHPDEDKGEIATVFSPSIDGAWARISPSQPTTATASALHATAGSKS